MPAYYGEMQARNDVTRMPATVTISQGKLRLSSGSSDLGEWPLNRVGLEEYTDKSILLAAEDEELIIFFDNHAEFVNDNARHMREPEGTKSPRHPAFRKEADGPSLSEEIKDDVSREVTPMVAEAQHLISLIEPGPPLWIAGIALLLTIIFLPGLVIGLGLVAGVAGLLFGGLAYADQKIAVRIPGPFTPAMLVMLGTVALLLAIFVSLVFGG